MQTVSTARWMYEAPSQSPARHVGSQAAHEGRSGATTLLQVATVVDTAASAFVRAPRRTVGDVVR